MEWWPITKSDEKIVVEWSPQGGRIRARKRDSDLWIDAGTSTCNNSAVIGANAVRRYYKNGVAMPDLQKHYG